MSLRESSLGGGHEEALRFYMESSAIRRNSDADMIALLFILIPCKLSGHF